MKKNFLEIRIGQYVCFLICLMLMLIIPIARDHKIIGIELSHDEEKSSPETLSQTSDGMLSINTSEIGKGIIGYGGPTPVEIEVVNDRIKSIKVLPNQETPEFLGGVINSDLLDRYKGLTLEEASQLKPDGVSGATYTSGAVIKNIKSGVDYALDPHNKPVKSAGNSGEPVGAKFIITIIIILAGAIIPLFVKNKMYRYAQLILDVVILGFWGGTFVSYSLMVSYLTNGLTQVIMIPVVLMLVTAFIYPMFGKVNHYCNWICPYGAIQELAGRCVKKKIRISPKATKILTSFREILWFALMWLLWTALWFDWMGFEPFAAFFFRDASPVVLGIAGGFLLLSFFVQRPYCRFVCPTGSLFKFAEGSK